MGHVLLLDGMWPQSVRHAIWGFAGLYCGHLTYQDMVCCPCEKLHLPPSFQDVPFRRSAECEELCVDWSTELRTWLPPSSSSPSPSSPPSLLTTLTQSSLWPVEVVKSTTAQVSKLWTACMSDYFIPHPSLLLLEVTDQYDIIMTSSRRYSVGYPGKTLAALT